MCHSLHNVCLSGLILASCAVGAAPLTAAEKPSAPAVERWANVLPATPRGVGRPIGDRRAWRAIAAAPAFKNAVPDATKLLSQPIPKLTDDLYLDFSRTGNRQRCQQVLAVRQGRFRR